MRPIDALAKEHSLAILVTKAAEQEVRFMHDTGEIRQHEVEELLDFFQFFTEACHDPKEENLLFARLRQRGLPADTGVLAELYRDHREFHARIRAMEHWLREEKKTSDGDVAEFATQLGGFLKLMRSHVSREEEILFPISEELLTDQDVEELAQGFDAIECEEIAVGVRQRYQELAHMLAGRPTESLEKEHKICYLVVAAAQREVARVRTGGEFHPELMTELVDFLHFFADVCHDPKEEHLLYARLAEYGMSTTTGILAEMEADHEEFKDRLQAISDHLAPARGGDARAIARVLDEIEAYLRLMEDHMRKEDEVLFPMVEHVLTHRDLEELARQFESIESQEIVEGVHDKYFELAHDLASH
jgi:hemerythrin-like domain-containing protein